jgi:sec-independent protein translocase protein TatC
MARSFRLHALLLEAAVQHSAFILHWISGVMRKVFNYFTEEQESSTLGDTLDKVTANPAGVLEHLNALRIHLTRAVLYLVAATALSFTFFEQILAILSRPLEGGMSSLVAIEVTEPVGTVMRVSVMTGFALAFPLIALEVWLFFAPGLSGRERRWGCATIPAATLLFAGGMAFAYFLLLPTALPFLLNFMGITTIPRPSSYVKFVTSLMFWIGVAFEFPLVIFMMAKLGWVQARTLMQQWRLAVVIIAVAAALITPTVDPVNMSIVMFPMIGLYFFSVLLAWIAQPR